MIVVYVDKEAAKCDCLPDFAGDKCNLKCVPSCTGDKTCQVSDTIAGMTDCECPHGHDSDRGSDTCQKVPVCIDHCSHGVECTGCWANATRNLDNIDCSSCCKCE